MREDREKKVNLTTITPEDRYVITVKNPDARKLRSYLWLPSAHIDLLGAQYLAVLCVLVIRLTLLSIPILFRVV